MADTEISIRPGVGMLGLFQHMKYQPWYALGELVDNAIQSYLANRDRLHDVDPDYCLQVEIEINRADGGSIVVRDNAAGIAAADWGRAFRVAEPPPDATGLSQFGIGMKAACCWFAEQWSLRTAHVGETSIRSVMFDVPQIVASRDESLHVVEEPTDVLSHFTEIQMFRLHRTPHTKTIGKIKTYLGGIYRQFLRNGDVLLTVNGERVEYDEPALLNAPRYNDRDGDPVVWRKDVDVRLHSGRRVTGFVGIREKGSTASAGLALFYRGKVVTGSGEEMYKPELIFGRSNSFRSQRVFGELHMDDFNVTYTKDALVWSDEEDEFIDLLRAGADAEPLPLLKQAENHRSREVTPTPKDVATFLDQIVDSFSVVEFDIEGSDTDDTSTEPPSTGDALPLESLDTPDTTSVDRKINIDFQGTTWDVDLRLVADEGVFRWLTVDRPEDNTLVLKVNQAHPFMRAYCEMPGQELEPVWRVAIALGLAQEMARLGGAVMPGLVTQNVNALLRTVLSHKS